MIATQSGERRATTIAAITAGGMIATFVASKAARDALVLEQFDVGVLPWLISSTRCARCCDTRKRADASHVGAQRQRQQWQRRLREVERVASEAAPGLE